MSNRSSRHWSLLRVDTKHWQTSLSKVRRFAGGCDDDAKQSIPPQLYDAEDYICQPLSQSLCFQSISAFVNSKMIPNSVIATILRGMPRHGVDKVIG